MPKIVIADDNHDLLEFLATVCRRAGWSVETCENGAGLVERLASGKDPVLALIDVHMPEMDGIEAIERLVEIRRPIRVRFMTGGDHPSMIAAKMIADARELQVGRSIYKPIARAELQTILEEEAQELSIMSAYDVRERLAD